MKWHKAPPLCVPSGRPPPASRLQSRTRCGKRMDLHARRRDFRPLSLSHMTRQEKYSDRNPVVRFVIGRFFRRLRTVLAELDPHSVLDAGCGEGEMLRRGVLPAAVRPVCLDLRPASWPKSPRPTASAHRCSRCPSPPAASMPSPAWKCWSISTTPPPLSANWRAWPAAPSSCPCPLNPISASATCCAANIWAVWAITPSMCNIGISAPFTPSSRARWPRCGSSRRFLGSSRAAVQTNSDLPAAGRDRRGAHHRHLPGHRADLR